MKALLCRQHGMPDTLVYEEIEDPAPQAGEVVVDVRAAGVNFPDVLIIQNKYQAKPALPFSPGAEFSGVVSAVGAGVTDRKIGDRVIGSVTYGAFAEKVKLAAARTIPMPDGLDFERGAAFLLTYGTSYHALVDRGVLTAGETLLVLGAAGGVGLAAIEIGKALGARVIAAASSAEKLQVCREHGADEFIDYSSEDLRERLRAITGGRGPDVIYDPVGGSYAEPAFRSIAWRGRYLVIGFANGRLSRRCESHVRMDCRGEAQSAHLGTLCARRRRTRTRASACQTCHRQSDCVALSGPMALTADAKCRRQSSTRSPWT
jgi:NADPH2:quinone reductase